MIYALTIGYPQIDRKSNEKITEAILSNNKTGNKIKDHINIYDYKIIMVKDLQLLRPQTDFFNVIGEYDGILAFSFCPLDDYYNFDPNTQKFYISYSKALKPYVLPKKEQGSHINFIQDHWLGKVFNNYKEYFKYVGGLEPSENLRKIITIESINKKIDKMLDRMIMRDSKNNAELLNEPIDKVDKQGEQYYDVFATTPGGLTVGAIVQAVRTKLIIHPEPSFKDENSFKDFTRKFLDAIEANLLGINIQTTVPQWVEQLSVETERKITNEFTDKIIKSSECKEIFSDYKNELIKIGIIKNLYFQSGTKLQNYVEFAFKVIGFEVENVSAKGESVDLVIRFKGKEFLVEVKGKEKYADKEDISNFIANNPNKNLIFVVNHFRFIDPKERKDKELPPYTSDAIKTIKKVLNDKSIESFYPITTMDLAECVQDKLTPDVVLAKLNEIAKIYMQR